MSFVKAYGGERKKGKDRAENDHYPTPPFVTHSLLINHLAVPKKIWEPATGRGWMAWEMERCDYSVTKTDLHAYPDPVVGNIGTGKDFLHPDLIDPTAQGVITNPPYARDMAQKFTQKAFAHYPFVAMLCRLMFAEGMRRHDMFRVMPPSDVYVYSGRFSCEEKRFLDDPISGMVSYAWWVWDYRGGEAPDHPRMHWLNTKEEYAKWLASMSSEELLYMKKKIGSNEPANTLDQFTG